MNQEFLEKLLSQPPIQPSYLKPFQDGGVQLIFGKRPVSKHSVEDDICIQNTAEDTTHNMDETKADLTGNPLEVDLEYNSNDTVQFVVVDRVLQRWYQEEAKQYALPVREARRVINKILKDKHLKIQYPIYVVCNGDDCKKTVLIGGHRTEQGYISTTINVMETILLEDVDQSIQNVILDHNRGCDQNQPVKSSVKATYNLYGVNVKNAVVKVDSLKKLNMDGHIYVDITSPKTDFIIKSFDASDIELHAIIVSGHPLLKLNNLWNELSMLQRILDLSSKPTNVEYTLNDNSMSSEKILNQINEVLLRPYELFNNEKQADLSNFRRLDTIDKFWDILICCEDTSILRDSFNFLFQELLNAQSPIHYIEDDGSNICKIFKDVSAGRISVGNISFLESIELLYDMGVRKLKFDLKKLLNCDNEIEWVWSSFYVTNITERSSRTTIRITKLMSNILKVKPEILSYVSQLYVAAELLELVKSQINLSEGNLRRLETALVEKYVKNTRTIEDFQTLRDYPLQEISVKLALRDYSFVTTQPSRWTMQLKSGPKVTMLDLTDTPIIPPVIYNYGLPEVDKSLTYYAVKMNRVSRNF